MADLHPFPQRRPAPSREPANRWWLTGRALQAALVGLTLLTVIGLGLALLPRLLGGETETISEAELLARIGVEEAELVAPEPLGAARGESTSAALPAGAHAVVYVSGAVALPGVYELPEGARVTDALEMAGGAQEDAALELVNLARPVSDGEQIHIFTAAEAPAAVNPSGVGAAAQILPSGGAGCVDLNSASADELATLPGIGPTLAERIIEHRGAAGPFSSKEALREVSGIGPKIFAGLEEDLCG